MKKGKPAPDPDAYVAALTGWRRVIVERLRTAVLGSAGLDEVIKWGNLVYFSNAPVLFIRAEDRRVLFGFWRGKRLRELDQRLKAGGKYELATMELHEGDEVGAAVVRSLVTEAVRLNTTLGNPTSVKPGGKRRR